MNYFDLAQKYAELSPCHKRKVGCVVVKDGEVIAYGYNHGIDEDCKCNPSTKNPDVLHAEEMALRGIDRWIYEGATLYVTHTPCPKCQMLISEMKIGEVITHE